MPWASDQNAGFYNPQSVGPALMTAPALSGLPTAAPIAAGGTWTSGILPGDGYQAIAVGLQSTQSGEISVQRYIDRDLGQVPQGAALTQAMTANQAAVLNVGSDGYAFSCFSITISNTGSDAATISNFAILMRA